MKSNDLTKFHKYGFLGNINVYFIPFRLIKWLEFTQEK